MKNHKRGFLGIAILIVVALVLIGGGVYFATRGKNQKNVDTATSSTEYQQATTTITATTTAITKPSSKLAISSVSPSVVVVGGTVTIQGRGFEKASRLNFYNKGSLENPEYVSSDGTEIRFVIDNNFFVHSLQSTAGAFQISIVNETISSNQIGLTVTAPTAAQNSATKYTDPTYGFILYYPSTWTLTSKGAGSRDIGIINFDNVGPDGGNSIDVTIQAGNKVTTTDNKFGEVSYFYDNSAGGWMTIGNDGITKPASASYYTVSGLPVFMGTNRWKTTIVPLSTTKFLVIHITGSGWTAVVDPLTKTVLNVGQNVDLTKLDSVIREELTASVNQ